VISKKLLWALVLPAAFMISPAQAVSIGGYDVGAFATSVTSFSGSITATGASTVVAATDELVDTYVTANTIGSTLGLGFVSGTLVNSTGNDLVLFGVGTVDDSFDLTIGAITQSLIAIDSGFLTPNGLRLNAVAVNLDDFSIGVDGIFTNILLTFQDTSSEFALAGALNPPPAAVPVPAAVWLFGSGLLGLVGVARRKK